MKKLLMTLVVAFALSGSIFAQYESHWPDFDYHMYPSQVGFVAAVQIDGVIITAEYAGWDALEVAAFVGDDVCRSNGNYLYNGYVEEYDDPFPILDGFPVYFDAETGLINEPIYFKMYNHATGVEYTECAITYLGEPLTPVTGTWYDQGWDDPENPVMLNFATPEQTTYTFAKEIEGYAGDEGGYYLIASPIGNDITPTAENGFLTDLYDLYYFDQAQDLEWMNYEANEFDIVNGKGYLYASNASTVLTFTGTSLYTGSGEFPLDYVEGKVWAGYNLVGNPYTESVYVNRDYYIMNEAGTDVMTDASSDLIGPMEGCFVVAEGEGETVTFSSEPEPEAKGSLVALNLSTSRGVIDRAIVRFGEGRQLPKFQLNRNNTKVYIPVGNEEYAIVRSEGMGEMPVNFKAAESGSYTLSVSAEEVGFNYLHLIDNKTGVDVDLLATPSYSFDASATDYASRFRLVYATGASEESFGFFSNGSFIVSNEGEATVQVVDVNGRILSSESISGSASVNVGGAAGVYMVRLINGDSVKVQKVIVK